MEPASKGRVVTVEQVAQAQPDVMLASWCGKTLDADEVRRRLGSLVPAVADGRVQEIASELILQPGPACLTDGLAAVQQAIWGPTP